MRPIKTEAIMLKTLIFAGVLAGLVPAAVQAQPRYWQDDQGQYQPRSHGDDYRYRSQPYPDRYYGYGYEGVPLVRGHPAYDEYGPDPNGLRAADGHRIKCKLVDQWDDYYGRIRRRQCW
jgi:hypothetical protein